MRDNMAADVPLSVGAFRSVLVLHPEPLVRDSLLAALHATLDLTGAVTTIDDTNPQVDAVLIGFDWLDDDAVVELRRLRGRLADATIVAVVRAANEQHLEAAAELGVTVAPTATPLSIVLDGLRGVGEGALAAWHDDAARRAAGLNLSPRELEVLRLMADGLTPDAAARELGITSHTCRDHLKRLRAKLGCASTLQAVVTAARLGILPAFGPAHGRPTTSRTRGGESGRHRADARRRS
jgi:DNA-binding CsgD family transcriptional regulator